MEQQELNTIRIGCATKNLKKVRNFVSNTLENKGVSDNDINMIVLAVDEVCANLIIHSNFCKEDQFLLLSIKFTQQPSGILFEIMDTGNSFDYLNYKEPSLHDIVNERKRGSLGLMLVRRIMDDIEFTTIDNKNICRLFKKTDQVPFSA